MSAAALEDRCNRLRQPVTELVATSLGAAYRPQDLPTLRTAIAAVREILAEDPSELPEGALRAWLPTGLRNLDRMDEALDAGDAAKSYAILTDKTDGFFQLTIGCAGFVGWATA
ncbi:hypothetical protein ET445_07100 [Agromyces protaetiae]|uniref:Uncharacterized protein n=1 Tax=Agromyces protaetiae TaxID=2509455 RepID=A0A4P6FFG8_9MICO|nr:hypothetical protein [Agromyces protaetiae]QAY73149.1 hypothetical protein ET445_07100 [Agromyces protaetiae]